MNFGKGFIVQCLISLIPWISLIGSLKEEFKENQYLLTWQRILPPSSLNAKSAETSWNRSNPFFIIFTIKILGSFNETIEEKQKMEKHEFSMLSKFHIPSAHTNQPTNENLGHNLYEFLKGTVVQLEILFKN